AYNVVPWAGSLKDDGWSSEELKVRNESRKILGLPELRVSATCVRVPVVTTHALTLHATFEQEVTADDARKLLGSAEGVEVLDDPAKAEFPTPADVVGTDPTWVGRIRQSIDDPNSLDLFLCGDNLRKGAALNTAKIAEVVAKEFTQALSEPSTDELAATDAARSSVLFGAAPAARCVCGPLPKVFRWLCCVGVGFVSVWVSLVSVSRSLGAGQRQLVEKAALVRGTDHFGGFHGASPAVVGAFHGENEIGRAN